MNSKYKIQVENIAKGMSVVLRDIIKSKDLVDTGLLHNTITVDVVTNGRGFDISFNAQYYYKYLNKPYNITKDFYKDSRTKKLMDELVDVNAQIFFDEITNILNF